MLIRTHPCMNVLFSTRKTTLSDLPALKPAQEASSARTDIGFSGPAYRELYQYVADLDLLVCGPQYWFYYGVDGKPDTEFTLEVCLPVQGKIPTALLPWFKRMPAFRCLSSRYEGPWEGLAEHYQKMIAEISARQLKMSGIFAESFLHIDFDQPENQITEVQIGIS